MNVGDVVEGKDPAAQPGRKPWMDKFLKKNASEKTDTPPAEAVTVNVEEEKTEAPKEKKEKAPKVPKEKKVRAPVEGTVKEGYSYGLVTRVKNAFSKEMQASIEQGAAKEDWVTGRGQSLSMVALPWIKVAKDNGLTPEWLASNRTAHVKVELKKKGVDMGKIVKAPKAKNVEEKEKVEGESEE